MEAQEDIWSMAYTVPVLRAAIEKHHRRKARRRLALRLRVVCTLLQLQRRAAALKRARLERSMSDVYGRGASQYPAAVMEDWLGCWRGGAAASKAKDWASAVALLETAANLRPDWAKGHANLEQAKKKLLAASPTPSECGTTGAREAAHSK